MNTPPIHPLVSICIPTYNGAHYLQEALDSIANQTYKNLEVVISDDASTDSTLDIVADFKNKMDVPIGIYHHTPNGIASNWNNTLEKATGKYIKFLFQDDVLHDNCIARMVDVLELDENCTLVTCKRAIISKKSNRFTQGWIANFKDLQVNLNMSDASVTIIKGKELLRAPFFKKKPINIIGEPTAIMFRKDIIAEIGYFDENMFQLVDYEFCLRMFKKYNIGFIKEKLVSFRLHETQASFLNNKENINDKEIYYNLLYKDYFWWLHKNFKWQLLKKHHWSFQLYRFLKYELFLKKVKE